MPEQGVVGDKVVKDFVQTLNKRMDLIFVSNRLATFKDWIFDVDAKCSASRMAEAGFYFIGTKEEPDAVRCYYCNKSLDCWSPDDDPWSEHLKHSPNCTFAQNQTGSAEETVQAFIERKNQLMQDAILVYHNEMEKKLEKNLQQLAEEATKVS